MTMQRKINLNSKHIGLEEFTEHFDEYLPNVKHLFRQSTIQKRENESQSGLAKRIFDLLYYNKGLGVKQIAASATRPDSILSSLGFDIVRSGNKSSSIIFKQSGTSGRVKNELLDDMVFSLKNNKKFNRIPVDISFGVELEFVRPKIVPNGTMTSFHNKMKALVGDHRYEHINKYCHNDGTKWILGKDSSVKGKDFIGFELSSPIMHCTKKTLKNYPKLSA